jgi:hypothetical protein
VHQLSLGLSHSLVAAAVTVLGSGGRTGDALITHVPIHGEVLEGAALSLRNEKCGEDACEHEGGEDLHNVVEPRARVVGCGCTANAEGRNGTLSDDGADLSHAGRDTVGGRPVAGGEALARNDEGSRVWSPCCDPLALSQVGRITTSVTRRTVEEELDQDVDAQHTMSTDVLVCETPDDEKDGQKGEANKLEGLATNSVNRGHR